ncbi:conserved hypothetical protein [Hyella patelloides LEGE 07179]|uniref:Uncharacterized protein n=1 Tax=Hyella patelloides LEGE 07179 TaxID=945734 RepID=A0A563VSX2_9CYAN|nr:hypothetical protein [Hyella patelloides]VEP14487.1 conserved hypothetical protein [Hyella patelloides LEGE 07179]
MKKNTAKTNQLPKDPQGQRFIAWFPHRWNFIEADEFDSNHPKISRKARRQAWQKARKAAKSKGKSKPNWRTETEYEIEPVVLWYRWKDFNDLVGVSFDKQTLYAVADIDRGSSIHPYNNEKAFREWLRSFEDIGLHNYVIIRSSFSDGLHIYFPLPEKTGTFNLACALQICSEKAGIKVKSGELEIFPNTKSFCKYKPTAYKAHRLPLQPYTGSVILDNDLNPIGDSTELFCDQMEWAAARQDMKALEIACNVAREIINFRRFGTRNKTQLAKFKRDLEIIIAEGWTGKGQSNFLLGKIAAYGMIFTEHEGEELANYIAQTAIACDGYQEYCNHHDDIKRRARDYGKSAERYYWKPGTPRKRAGTYRSNFCNFTNSNPNHNQQVAEKAQNRIIDGVNSLLSKGINLIVTGIVAFRKALREEIQKLHGVSVGIATLKKYNHLWHPKEKGIVLGTVSSTSMVTEPEIEIEEKPEIESDISVETSDIEEKIPEPTPDPLHPETTPVKEPKHSEIKGCTHLNSQTAKTETPKHSEIKGCTHLPLYEGLNSLDAMVGNYFLYSGQTVSGLIGFKNSQNSQVRTLEPNELVKLISTYHSSDLRDEPPLRKIVYVQPIERAKQEQWEDEAGIAVFLDRLEKLELLSEPNQKKEPKKQEIYKINNNKSTK